MVEIICENLGDLRENNRSDIILLSVPPGFEYEIDNKYGAKEI
jgi:hypothetical protein